jgi:peptidoglycan/LPS O-acetylase OafA/YrhL
MLAERFLCLALVLVAAALISFGLCCVREARWKAEALAEQFADVHPFWRFSFLLRFYRSKSFVWSIRLTGITAILGGLFLIVCGLRAVLHPM